MVSIIMPTYNRAYIVEQAIKSVQRQSYQDWELIIVDDASTDKTGKVIQKYIDSRIHYYLNTVNQGANASRNFGAAQAKGEFLAFLDSDNYWPEDRLEMQMQMVERYRHKSCFFYGKVQILNGNEVIIVPEEMISTEKLKDQELKGNVVDTNTILIAKSLFEKAGGFIEELPRFQDWEFVLRLLLHFNVEAVGCERIFSYNTIQENSITNNERSYAKAIGFMIEKYFNHYLSAEGIVNHLMGLYEYASSQPDLIYEVIKKTCDDNLSVFSEMTHKTWIYQKKVQELQQIIEKKREMENLLYKWLGQNISIKTGGALLEYFERQKNIQSIAIYGLGKLGRLFFDDMKDTSIHIKYGIDQQKQYFEDLQIKRPYDILDRVDLLVITVLEGAEEIKRKLKENYKGEIITISELIRSI